MGVGVGVFLKFDTEKFRNKLNNKMNPYVQLFGTPVKEKKSTQLNGSDSPDYSDQFKKHLDAIDSFSKAKELSSSVLLEYLTCIKQFTKKAKYQFKILKYTKLIQYTLIPLMYTGNIDASIQSAKIFLNIAKNKNNHNALSHESTIFRDLFNLLFVHSNSKLTTYILKILFNLTENKDILRQMNFISLKFTNDHSNDTRNIIEIDLPQLTRLCVEKVLDDLNSFNKNLMLNIINNIYNYDYKLMSKNSIEAIIRCIGDKENETIISALKIILLYTDNEIYKKISQEEDNQFHSELINNNLIFRLVRIYKQGIIQMDIIIVKILLNLFKNKSLHEVLFSNNMVLVLENYLIAFSSELNEEVIKTVFDIFNLIREAIGDDLRKKIFQKALNLAQNSKIESFILSCLSIINTLIEESANIILEEEENIKNIYEFMPIFFRSKNKNILQHSLSIFERAMSMKKDYFIENYVKANDKMFSIKPLIHHIINIINEFFHIYEIVLKSCKILIKVSDIIQLQVHFLLEPQITILRVFNEDLINMKNTLLREIDMLKKRTYGLPNIQKLKDSERTDSNIIKHNASYSSEMLSSYNKGKKKNFYRVISKNKNRSKSSKDDSKDEEEIKREISNKSSLLMQYGEILKSSIQILSNLTKQVENLEILTNKGFLEIINKLLNVNYIDALPSTVECIQGFCCSLQSIEIILANSMIGKIIGIVNKCEDKASKLEIFLSIRNILESDIKLQKQFITDNGISVILDEVASNDDKLNAMILKVIYVISCNINKLVIIFFTDEAGQMNFDLLEDDDDSFESGVDDSGSSAANIPSKQHTLKSYNPMMKDMERTIAVFDDNENNFTEFKREEDSNQLIFKHQILSRKNLMEKILRIGELPRTSMYTNKELVKILINLYLNRHYLKYFTKPEVFERVMKIIVKILNNFSVKDQNHDIIKLLLVFLKFICEEEDLIRKFLETDVISNIVHIINDPQFYDLKSKAELEEFNYNFSLVILRLTEFKGHTNKFSTMDNLFNILEKLYRDNIVNGKIYIVSIMKNILSEKEDFFGEEDVIRFVNYIVSQNNTLVIYEFVELLKILVHNRLICKRMESVFKYLINEMKSVNYSTKFKKKLLELILCLSYESENIQDYALHDLLILIKNLDITINKKTTLLILMNFSSIATNFSYLQLSTVRKKTEGNLNDSTDQMLDYVDGMTIPKKDIISIVNHLLDSDKFSQTLIQRFLINITSIDNIDLSIISDKVFNVLIEIIISNRQMQESIVVFALAILINLSNRNILKLEVSRDNKEEEDGGKNSSFERNNNQPKSNVSTPKRNISKYSLGGNKKDMDEPLEGCSHDINTVDYILNKLNNIIDILHDLFERKNLDIASLAVMLCCNLSRKIKLSCPELDDQMTLCIENFFLEIFHKSDFKNDSGKFFLMAIIKYCICLSNDERKVSTYRKLFEYVLNAIMKDSEKFINFKLNKEDFLGNTINFVLVESHLKFLNIVIELNQNSKMFQENLSNTIYTFFINFVQSFAEILEDPKLQIEKNVNLQDLIVSMLQILSTLLKVQDFVFDTIKPYMIKIISYLISYNPPIYHDELKSLFTYMIYTLNTNQINMTEVTDNQELKKWLVKLFKITTNSIHTDYYCLKLFSQVMRNEKHTEVFWKSTKFMRKLASYLTRNSEDEKTQIMKKEVEKIVNIISFNHQSHKQIYNLGIYNYCKKNLYIKFMPGKNNTFSNDDVILLVNMILNRENHEFIKEDIISLLKSIFLCKDLMNTIKIQLFDMFVSYTLEKQLVKIFKEDYLIIFNLLYENLRENFSDMIFLVDNFTKKYENFAKKLVSDDAVVVKIYEDFLNFDKNFPSQYEELNSFFKILGIFIFNNITPTLGNMIYDIMKRAIGNQECLKDINILNSLLAFVFDFFNKYVEINKSLSDIEQVGFIKNYQITQLIDTICINSIKQKEKINLYILTTIILQEDYKAILKPLMVSGSYIFKKEFLLSFLGKLIDRETIDIREFVYIINIGINLNTVNGKLPFIEEFINQVIDVYNTMLKKLDPKDPDTDVSDPITSIYFFCDLVKSNELSRQMFIKILKFIIDILVAFHTTIEQKEILIRYYQEILNHFKINNLADLQLVSTFYLKIHSDPDLNFIDYLVFGTMLVNSSKEIIVKNLDIFLKMLEYIIDHEFEKQRTIEFLKYFKQIYLLMVQEKNTKEVRKLKLFFHKNIQVYEAEINQDEQLLKKKEKLVKLLS
jgi:hypothetical protein